MHNRCATLIAVSLMLSCWTFGCQTPPQPVKESGWEANAASAANAEPAPEVRTAQRGHQTGNAVVASAMETLVAAKENAGGGPLEKKPAPLVAVANVEANADLTEVPGPEASAADVARWLSTAHRQGKSGKWIQRKLNRSKPDELDKSRIYWTTGDYDGDGQGDLAAAFYAECKDIDCHGPGRWSVGVVWGSGGWSQLAKSERFAPEFIGPADMTGDQHPELIFTFEKCGAHTCYENLQVLSAHGQKQFRQIFRLGDEVKARGARGLPQKVELVRSDDDQLPHLMVSGGLVGSAGAGNFQRVAHTMWAWDAKSQQFEHTATRWTPSDIRLHRFHDAVAALERGNLKSAKEDLDEVIRSDALRELAADAKPDPNFEEALRTQLGLTARFMLARIALQEGDRARTDRIVEELEASAPKSPATEAARTLQSTWVETRSVPRACQAAAQLFPATAADDWVLDAVALGYNAPVKFTDDFNRGLCAGLVAPEGV
jgi:hypothetical protein